MPNICILTDSTAQFTRPKFSGYEHVNIIPFEIQSEPQVGENTTPRNPTGQRLVPPSSQDFFRCYTRLIRKYDAILVLTLSSSLSPTLEHALSALEQVNNNTIVVIDSQTTAVGLGMLIQEAAGAASRGASLREIERRVRAAIPHIYMLCCIPELTCLAHAGYMGFTQALVGELMGLLPVFTIEEGRLIPLEKVRTPRHLFESFQDFMAEFETPARIALIRGVNHTSIRTRPLRQYIQDAFPETLFSEHSINPHVASLFGSQSIGLVIMDQSE